jgi:hypothetical protein
MARKLRAISRAADPHGVGSNLLLRALGGDLGGKVELEIEPEGLAFGFMANLLPHSNDPGLDHTVS